MINPTNFYTVQGWMLADLGLKGTELATYAIIYGFSQDGKSEYAGSSAYLCEWLGCTKKTALTTLAALTEKGYLRKREIIQNGVKLCAYVAIRTPQKQQEQPGEEITPGAGKNLHQGGEEITPGRCKNYTGGGEEITPNNKLDNIAISNIKYIVDYLNKKAGTRYKPSSKETQKHINARLAEGYTVADFMQVIDKKCAAWKGDAKMEEYLRPSTLFGTKFEGYLNAPAAAPQPARPAGRGYGVPAANIGPNGIAIDPTKNDLDGLI